MKSPRGKNKRRQLFDVVRSDKPGFFYRFRKLIGWHDVVNLRPAIYRRYPIRALALVLIVASLGFVNRYFFISAQSASYYPTSCLGEWENVERAEHQPESTVSADVFINESNAARYPGGSQNIFCGSFLPEDFKPPGKLKSSVLTLVFQVGEAATPPGQQGIIETSTSTNVKAENATSTKEIESVSTTPNEEVFQVTGESEGFEAQSSGTLPEPTLESIPEPLPPLTSEPAPDPTPPPTPEPIVEPTPEPSPASFLWKWFLTSAFAQEGESKNSDNTLEKAEAVTSSKTEDQEQTITSPPEESKNQKELMEEVVELGPPIVASLEAVSSTEESSSVDIVSSTVMETSSEIVVPSPPPDEYFLAVNYSLDGQNWQTLARVSEKNWNLFTIAIPITSWDELKRLQVSIQGIPTTASQPLPKVFLDGMFLGVEYEDSLLEDILDITDESKKLEEKPLRTLPSADPEEFKKANELISSSFGGRVVLSQQFKNDKFITFKGQVGEIDQIFLLDTETNQFEQLTRSDDFKSEPAVIDGYVTWNEASRRDRGKYGEVFLYDINTKETKQITEDQFTDHLPYFEEGVLVWEKIDAQANRHIYQYSLGSGDIVQRDGLGFVTSTTLESLE